jgi:glucose uptake protein GlcU
MIDKSLLAQVYVSQVREGSLLDTAQTLSLKDIINRGIAYALLAAGFLSIVFIFIGGISFITSGGNEDKIKQAVSTIRYAIVGLIITILAVLIVNILGRTIGLDVTSYISFDEIARIIQTIADEIRTGGTTSSNSLR